MRPTRRTFLRSSQTELVARKNVGGPPEAHLSGDGVRLRLRLGAQLAAGGRDIGSHVVSNGRGNAGILEDLCKLPNPFVAAALEGRVGGRVIRN